MRTIKEDIEDSSDVELTSLECKFIEVLSNGNINTWNDVSNYIYKCNEDKNVRNLIRIIRFRLTKKIKLNIRTINNYGFILYDEVLIK